jgi:hypothetical protein
MVIEQKVWNRYQCVQLAVECAPTTRRDGAPRSSTEIEHDAKFPGETNQSPASTNCSGKSCRFGVLFGNRRDAHHGAVAPFPTQPPQEPPLQ